MDHYAGIDVSLEASSVCVVDGAGKIIREAKLASEPEVLIGWFASLGFDLTRIGLEAGPLSQWLYAAMKQAGLAVELLETRHVRVALQTMPVKTDRNDARGIAFIFVIVTRLASRRGGNGCARFDDHLLRGLVQTHQRARRIMRPLIDFQHVFHVGDKARAGLRRDHPLLLEMRLENVFLSVRPIVLSLAFSTMFSTTPENVEKRS